MTAHQKCTAIVASVNDAFYHLPLTEGQLSQLGRKTLDAARAGANVYKAAEELLMKTTPYRVM